MIRFIPLSGTAPVYTSRRRELDLYTAAISVHRNKRNQSTLEARTRFYGHGIDKSKLILYSIYATCHTSLPI
ncbi:hypothetical protein VTN77DRAFT_5822 [Rasamsonia byssochlamydoides]|uniref:uncharacterized protein n=1 Tax=Rasamsonia byssochlamydoides TaxID=89139 RepID=UPI0037422ACE